MRLLERRFRVKVSVDKAWAQLEHAERWPSWAQHIRRVELRPPGVLVRESAGTILLANGIRSVFRMEELNPPRNWKWVGPFLWMTVHYDHQFASVGSQESEIRFVLDAQGFGTAVLGRLFAMIYARNLDRAIPLLIQELQRDRL